MTFGALLLFEFWSATIITKPSIHS